MSALPSGPAGGDFKSIIIITVIIIFKARCGSPMSHTGRSDIDFSGNSGLFAETASSHTTCLSFSGRFSGLIFDLWDVPLKAARSV